MVKIEKIKIEGGKEGRREGGESLCKPKKNYTWNNQKIYKIVGNFKLIHECGHDRLVKPTWQTSQISKC
jgi:hypothetical protein